MVMISSDSKILHDELEQGKVSVIMPAYNCEKFIVCTLDSLFSQTYTKWELVVVDDCSTDKTAEILKKYAEKDCRIVYVRNEINSGAAVTRNKAVSLATGQYLAFLDSDDVWKEDKLEKQIAFMQEEGASFSCTEYDKIDENNKNLNRIVKVSEKLDYWGLLKNCPGNSTIIYDAHALGKHIIPDIRKRNDYVMWLSVIKASKFIVGLPVVLSSHRVRKDSISAQKVKLIKYHWLVYRCVEKLGLIKSSFLIVYWIWKGILNKMNK